MSSSLKEEFLLSSITLNHPDHSCFHRSQFNLPSWAYPLWRLFWCIWHITWLVVSGVRTQNTAPDQGDGAKWFVYASNWTFLLTTVFCLVDFAVVAADAWRRSREHSNDNTETTNGQVTTDNEEILFQGEFTLVEGIKTQPNPWSSKLQWCLFETVNCVNLLTTISFWASQYKDGDTIHADIVIFNIVNTVFVIVNTMITGMPVRILHAVYPAVFIGLYFLFNLIYFLSDGTAISGSDVTFRPLEWDEAYPTAFTIIGGFLLFIPLGHLVFFSLFTLRIYLADKLDHWQSSQTNDSKSDQQQPSSGTYRKRDSSVKIDDGTTNTGGGASYQGQRNYLETSARVNEGFEMDLDNRTCSF